MKKLVETNDTQEELKNIIIKVLDKGSNYVIKSMPVGEKIKEFLMTVKESLGEKEFGKIVTSAVSSSLREGLEAVGVEKKDISKIDQMLKVAIKGGLTNALNVGIDIVSNAKKYGNLFSDYIEDYYKSLKGYVTSNEFKNKLTSSVDRKIDKVEDFNDMCDEWYKAYAKLDVDKTNELAQRIKKMKNTVSFDTDSVTRNAIIQNMNEMFNGKVENAQDIDISL